LVAAGAAVAGYLFLRRSHAKDSSPSLDFIEHEEDHHHGTILRPEVPPDMRRRGGKAGSRRKSGSQ
jgi:hypothetical protein